MLLQHVSTNSFAVPIASAGSRSMEFSRARNFLLHPASVERVGHRPSARRGPRFAHSNALAGEPWSAGDLLFFDERPSVNLQLIVEMLNKLQDVIAIGSHNWMNHFSKEAEERVCRTIKQREAVIAINPVVVPIQRVVDPMLPNIPCGVFEAAIR